MNKVQAHQLKILLPFLDLPFVEVLLEQCSILHIPKGEEVIKQNGFTPGVPIVLEGLIKVSTQHDHKSLLLYYIEPGQSCVMSFSSCLKGNPSQVFATTVEDTKILLVPIDKLEIWLKQYPSFNTLFYSQFETRYSDLLGNIQQLLFYNIDERLYEYLKNKITLSGKRNTKITHKQIANDLGTAREVISRTLKKLEKKGQIIQSSEGIRLV